MWGNWMFQKSLVITQLGGGLSQLDMAGMPDLTYLNLPQKQGTHVNKRKKIKLCPSKCKELKVYNCILAS